MLECTSLKPHESILPHPPYPRGPTALFGHLSSANSALIANALLAL